MTGHVGDMTVPHSPFLLSRILFLGPRAVQAAVWAQGDAVARFVQVTAILGEHPGVLVLVHPSQHLCLAACLALGHVTPEQQRGDNQPGLFSRFFFSPKEKLAL